MTIEAGMLKRWRHHDADPSQEAAARELASALAIEPVAALLLIERGMSEPMAAASFLKPKLTDLHDPVLLPNLPRAAQRLVDAIRRGQRIVIYGDYDVDGVCSSAILWHMLRLTGADVRTYVPHRVDEGYGLNCDAIRAIASGENGGNESDPLDSAPVAIVQESKPPSSINSPPLIISVDCGITAVEPAQVAREHGADLIITDHHEFDVARLPEAVALVHPRLPHDGPAYPFAELCGAGVAFKVAWQFAKSWCGTERLPLPFRDLLLDLLSLAALGTVADIVPLVGENRVITTFGLGQIKRTRFTGLNALIDASRLRDEKIDSYHVGFVLGPRLNACGRMGHAKEAVRLLTTAGAEESGELAAMLTEANDERRATERAIFDEAKAMVTAAGYDKPDTRAIVLGKEGWHTGVVGIVASRLVEAFGRPVVLMNFNGEEGMAHGSARSVEGVSIHEAFAACASHLASFGGHAMAAGLRMETVRVDDFRAALVSFINERLSAGELTPILNIDAVVTLDELTHDLMRSFQRLAPFGRANPAPVLACRRVRLERPAQRMGGQGKHLSLSLRQGKRVMRAVWWSMGDLAGQLAVGDEFDVAFEPVISEWQGEKRLEIHIKDIHR